MWKAILHIPYQQDRKVEQQDIKIGLLCNEIFLKRLFVLLVHEVVQGMKEMGGSCSIAVAF